MKSLLFCLFLMSISWGGEVKVKARLLELPGTLPPNDLYNYMYIMKYKVLHVLEGELDEREIMVAHYNPLQARAKIGGKMKEKIKGDLKKFRVGGIHVLTLNDDLEGNWQEAVEDEYIDEEGTRWLATKTDKKK